MKTPNTYGWFEEKHYGWGWVPVKWQGWAVTLLYVVIIVYGASRLESDSNPWKFGIIVALATAVLIWICAMTGGWPRWRWGDRIWK